MSHVQSHLKISLYFSTNVACFFKKTWSAKLLVHHALSQKSPLQKHLHTPHFAGLYSEGFVHITFLTVLNNSIIF